MKYIISNFPLCGGCSRKEKRDDLQDGEYYCPVVEESLLQGIVTDFVDATACVNKGEYKPLQEYDCSFNY